MSNDKNSIKSKSIKAREIRLTSMDIFALAFIMKSEDEPLSILINEITDLMKENGLHRNTITKTKKRLKQLFNDYHKNTSTTKE